MATSQLESPLHGTDDISSYENEGSPLNDDIFDILFPTSPGTEETEDKDDSHVELGAEDEDTKQRNNIQSASKTSKITENKTACYNKELSNNETKGHSQNNSNKKEILKATDKTSISKENMASRSNLKEKLSVTEMEPVLPIDDELFFDFSDTCLSDDENEKSFKKSNVSVSNFHVLDEVNGSKHSSQYSEGMILENEKDKKEEIKNKSEYLNKGKSESYMSRNKKLCNKQMEMGKNCLRKTKTPSKNEVEKTENKGKDLNNVNSKIIPKKTQIEKISNKTNDGLEDVIDKEEKIELEPHSSDILDDISDDEISENIDLNKKRGSVLQDVKDDKVQKRRLTIKDGNKKTRLDQPAMKIDEPSPKNYDEIIIIGDERLPTLTNYKNIKIIREEGLALRKLKVFIKRCGLHDDISSKPLLKRMILLCVGLNDIILKTVSRDCSTMRKKRDQTHKPCYLYRYITVRYDLINEISSQVKEISNWLPASCDVMLDNLPLFDLGMINENLSLEHYRKYGHYAFLSDFDVSNNQKVHDMIEKFNSSHGKNFLLHDIIHYSEYQEKCSVNFMKEAKKIMFFNIKKLQGTHSKPHGDENSLRDKNIDKDDLRWVLNRMNKGEVKDLRNTLTSGTTNDRNTSENKGSKANTMEGHVRKGWHSPGRCISPEGWHPVDICRQKEKERREFDKNRRNMYIESHKEKSPGRISYELSKEEKLRSSSRIDREQRIYERTDSSNEKEMYERTESSRESEIRKMRFKKAQRKMESCRINRERRIYDRTDSSKEKEVYERTESSRESEIRNMRFKQAEEKMESSRIDRERRIYDRTDSSKEKEVYERTENSRESEIHIRKMRLKQAKEKMESSRINRERRIYDRNDSSKEKEVYERTENSRESENRKMRFKQAQEKMERSPRTPRSSERSMSRNNEPSFKRSTSQNHKVSKKESSISVDNYPRKSRSSSSTKVQEYDSATSKALRDLAEVHDRSCQMYIDNPNAHPDYNKEYYVFYEAKSQKIREIGGDPNDYDFLPEWKYVWQIRSQELFREAWLNMKNKCIKMMEDKKMAQGKKNTQMERNVDEHNNVSKSSKRKRSCEKKEPDYKSRRKIKDKSISPPIEKRQKFEKERLHNIEGYLSTMTDKSQVEALIEEELKSNNNSDKTIDTMRSSMNSRISNEDLQANQKTTFDSRRLMELASPFDEENDMDSLGLEEVGESVMPFNLGKYIPESNECEEEERIETSNSSENVLEILLMLTKLGDRLGSLGVPIKILFDKANKEKMNNRSAINIFTDPDMTLFMQLISNKLIIAIEDENNRAIEKVIYQEVKNRVDGLLKVIEETFVEGLNVQHIAEKSLGMESSEIIKVIKSGLEMSSSSFSETKLMNIFKAVKEKQFRCLESKANINKRSGSVARASPLQAGKNVNEVNVLSTEIPFNLPTRQKSNKSEKYDPFEEEYF